MNLNKLGIIIGREYLNKVKKKSFLIITFVAPVIFAALCILPSLIMMNAKEETKKVAVVDASGIVFPTLENTDVVAFYDFSGRDVDSLKTALDAVGMDVLYKDDAMRGGCGRSAVRRIFSRAEGSDRQRLRHARMH